MERRRPVLRLEAEFATGLTSGKVRCSPSSPCSRGRSRCAWLRVAPLLPSPALRAVARAAPGRDGKAGCRSNRKAGFALPPRLTSGSGHGSILVRQCPARSGAFLDEAIRPLILIVALHLSSVFALPCDRT